MMFDLMSRIMRLHYSWGTSVLRYSGCVLCTRSFRCQTSGCLSFDDRDEPMQTSPNESKTYINFYRSMHRMQE